MSNHVNYNKMHNHAPKNNEHIEEPVVEEAVEAVEEPAVINEPVIEETIEVAEETPVVEETVVEESAVEEPIVEAPQNFAVATVVDCGSLNLREHPDTKAKVLSVLPKNTEVQVEITNAFDDWYHVCTATGLEGYCMKQYIAIKE